MKITAATFILMGLSCFVFGQTIDANRLTSWPSTIHTSVNIPNTNVIQISQEDENATSSILIDNDLQQAVNQLGTNGGVIYLSKGSFLITKTFKLPSNTYIIGSGANNTTLKIDNNGIGHGILAQGTTTGSWMNLSKASKKGSNILVVAGHSLKVGDLIRIKINDEALIISSWAKGTVGQITKVEKINGSEITISDSLRLNLELDLTPQVIVIEPVKNCGILNLSIERLDATSAQTDNIQFKYTENALVYGVKSTKCNYAHINNVYAYESFVYGSYFNDAHDFGEGGKGYGVALAFTSSQCVIENNVFDRLRHSILFQAGSNGNVIGYNYSKNPVWTSAVFPTDFSGDIVMHGNYPFSNLVEGNIIQNLVIDNSHGINGPNNVFLRNRVQNAGIFMNQYPASNGQMFLGNEITGMGTVKTSYYNFPKGSYVVEGNNHIELANLILGEIRPANTILVVNSYFYTTKPWYFKNNNWPTIGNENTFNTQSIPATERCKTSQLTIDYPYDNPYDAGIIAFEVSVVDNKALLEWKISGTGSCNQFEIFRINNMTVSNSIGYVNCKDESERQSSFVYDDFNFSEAQLEMESVAYFVSMTNDKDEVVYSDTINPANSLNLSVQIHHDGTWTSNKKATDLELYNLNGQLVGSFGIENSLPNNLSCGIYYVRMISENREVGYKKMMLGGSY